VGFTIYPNNFRLLDARIVGSKRNLRNTTQSIATCAMIVARHETGRTTTTSQRTNNTMNAITAGLLHNLRLEYQILTYNEQLANMKQLGMAERVAVQDSPQQDAIITLLEELNDQAQESCTQIVADLVDSGINATSACGEGGDFVIELKTASGMHVIAGCQL
jgi:hypothetical protein